MAEVGTGKQIKKKIRIGGIVADFEGSAIVVNYTTEVSMVEEATRRVLHTATSSGQKRFPVRVTEHTDLPRLADELIEKSSYINPSKRDTLLTVLNAMRMYSLGQEPPEQLRINANNNTDNSGTSGGSIGGVKRTQDILYEASRYQDMLYEEMETKIKGAEGLMEMAKEQSNLEVMAQSGSLLEVISRVTREEAAKNIDLATALIGVVFCFSSYKEFIPVLASNRFGEACFVVIETELKRRDVLAEDIRQKRSTTATADVTQDIKRYHLMKRKQVPLLAVATHVLLNMAEDPPIVEKMIKRGLLSLLVRCLEVEGEDLQRIVVVFLKNLSVYKENIPALSSADLMPKLLGLLNGDNVSIKDATLRLIINLSYTPAIQQQMLNAGYIRRLVELLLDTSLQPTVLKVLYPMSISMTDLHKQDFVATEIATVLFQLMLRWPEEIVGEIIVALASNLTLIDELAPKIIGGMDGLGELVDRASSSGDVRLFRMLRNACNNSKSCKPIFERHIERLVSLAVHTKQPDMAADLMGIMSSISSSSIDWPSLVHKYDLIDFLSSLLIHRRDNTPSSSVGVVVEAMAMLGTVVSDRKVAAQAAREDLTGAIMSILSESRATSSTIDATTISRLVFTIYRFLLFKDTRTFFMNSRFVLLLLEFYTSKHPATRKIVSTCLDLLAECEPSLADLIKMKKFEYHNGKWVAAIRSGDPRFLKFEVPPPGTDDDSEESSSASASGASSLASTATTSPIIRTMSNGNHHHVTPPPSTSPVNGPTPRTMSPAAATGGRKKAMSVSAVDIPLSSASPSAGGGSAGSRKSSQLALNTSLDGVVVSVPPSSGSTPLSPSRAPVTPHTNRTKVVMMAATTTTTASSSSSPSSSQQRHAPKHPSSGPSSGTSTPTSMSSPHPAPPSLIIEDFN